VLIINSEAFTTDYTPKHFEALDLLLSGVETESISILESGHQHQADHVLLFPEISDLGYTLKHWYARPEYNLILQLQTWLFVSFLDRTNFNNDTILSDYNEKNIGEMKE